MNLKENFNNLKEKAMKLTGEQLKTYKTISFVGIVVDIIGIYYFLHLKSLGMALLIIILVVLGIILYLESKLPKEEPKKEPINPEDRVPPGYIQKKKKEGKKMEEGMEGNEEESGFDFGLPSADDFNDRMKEAFTMTWI